MGWLRQRGQLGAKKPLIHRVEWNGGRSAMNSTSGPSVGETWVYRYHGGDPLVQVLVVRLGSKTNCATHCMKPLGYGRGSLLGTGVL